MLERLKKARKDLGYTQSEFAKKLGMTQQSYNLIENGKTTLSDKHIKPICAIFSINEEWLRGDDAPEFINTQKIEELKEIAEQLCPDNQEMLLSLGQKMLAMQWEKDDPTPVEEG